MHIAESNYNGILTLSTVVDNQYIKQRYLFYSKRQAYKEFRQYIKQLTKGTKQ